MSSSDRKDYKIHIMFLFELKYHMKFVTDDALNESAYTFLYKASRDQSYEHKLL